MTLRIGVIGTGAIGREHARRINQILQGGKIIALSDVNADNAAKVKADIAPDAQIFATGEELISSPLVDAVLIVQVGFMRRYDTGYRMLKKVVGSEIGPLP